MTGMYCINYFSGFFFLSPFSFVAVVGLTVVGGGTAVASAPVEIVKIESKINITLNAF